MRIVIIDKEKYRKGIGSFQIISNNMLNDNRLVYQRQEPTCNWGTQEQVARHPLINYSSLDDIAIEK